MLHTDKQTNKQTNRQTDKQINAGKKHIPPWWRSIIIIIIMIIIIIKISLETLTIHQYFFIRRTSFKNIKVRTILGIVLLYINTCIR